MWWWGKEAWLFTIKVLNSELFSWGCMFEIDIACEMWFSAINICGSVYLHLLIAAGKRSLGQGNVFTGVCLSVCPQGGLWCHFLSGCLIPCSLKGVCVPGPMFHLGGLYPGGSSLPPPQIRKSGCTHPTGMLSCFLGGLSLHLNHLITSRTANYDWSFGTLPFGLFWSNLDTRDLETYPRTYSGHFWNMSIFDDSRSIWVLFRKWVVSENQFSQWRSDR